MTDTTPAPPTDTDALNRQIAEMRGYTNFETDEYGRHFAVNAIGERWVAPDYAGDPAAAFELLNHALTIRQVFKHEISKGLPDGPHRYCRIYTAFGTFVGCADTLPLAIALSCRDALSSLQGDTDNGTA